MTSIVVSSQSLTDVFKLGILASDTAESKVVNPVPIALIFVIDEPSVVGNEIASFSFE